MNIKNTLYLGSDSYSRKLLLTQSKIPFIVVGHSADEDLVDKTLRLEDQVKYIAELKMKHVNLQNGSHEGEVRFVLTADTMGCDGQERVHGKPKDKEDAYAKVRALSGRYRCSTGYCIEKRIWKNGAWVTEKNESKVISAYYTFSVPEYRLEDYFEHSPALGASGAIAVEEYGLQFLEKIEGSYSTIVGLPLYEVRTTLEEFGFFN